jgi:hypothetical protein
LASRRVHAGFATPLTLPRFGAASADVAESESGAGGGLLGDSDHALGGVSIRSLSFAMLPGISARA